MSEPIYEILAVAMDQYERSFGHSIPMSAQQSWNPNTLLGRLNKAMLERKPISESEFLETHYNPASANIPSPAENEFKPFAVAEASLEPAWVD